MKMPPFELLNWLSAYESADPPIRCNLAGSAGPVWTFGQLLDMADGQMRAAIEDMTATYGPTAGSLRLRELIGKLHGVDPDWVVVTTGASEALSLLLCVISEPDASVVLPAPGYPATEILASLWGLKVRHYELARERGFEQSAALVLAAVDPSTRLALVNSPHNPTGSIMPHAQLRALAQALAERSVPLLCDEVFHRVYFQEEQLSAMPQHNTIVIGDMSKALSLPGLRIGWLIDADSRRRGQIIEARGSFAISGSPLLEAFSCAALQEGPRILERARSVTRTNLAALRQFIQAHASVLEWIEPQGGTLVFPWLRDGDSARPLCEQWAEAGVLVAPGDCFGRPHHMRIGFGSSEPASFVAALEAMAPALHARSQCDRRDTSSTPRKSLA